VRASSVTSGSASIVDRGARRAPRRPVEPLGVRAFFQGVLFGVLLLAGLPIAGTVVALLVGVAAHLCGFAMDLPPFAEAALVSVLVLGGFTVLVWPFAKSGRRDTVAGITVVAVVACVFCASLWVNAAGGTTPPPAPAVLPSLPPVSAGEDEGK
jgi:hypothetical protein